MSNERKTIIMVDDNIANLTMGKSMLRTFYQVIPVPSADRMFATLEKITPDLILLDIDMPEMNGYEAIELLKADDHLGNIPVIFLTALSDESNELEGFDLGAADYITKPFSAPLLLKRIEKELTIVRQKKDLLEAQAKLRSHLDNLEAMVQEKTDIILHLHDVVLATVVDMVEFRDKYTGWHVIRTQRYMKALLDEMTKVGVYADEISGWDINSVVQAAKLHDVGKIAVPDAILCKPGRLTDDEFGQMKSHVEAGTDAIERIISNTNDYSFLNHALHIAGTHHEKWNGSGYPLGLKGKNIPLEGRLMAIADVYDALISARPYKEAMPHEKACKIITEGAGTHFDPVLVDVFEKTKGVFEQIAKEIGN
jgi:putative two-component system response regulator